LAPVESERGRQLNVAVISTDDDLATQIAFAVARGSRCTAEQFSNIPDYYQHTGVAHDAVIVDNNILKPLAPDDINYIKTRSTLILLIQESEIPRVPELIEQVDTILIRDRQFDIAGSVVYLAYHGYSVMPRGASTLPVADALRLRLIHHLTPREMAILSLLGQGADNRTISSMLGISEASVKGHLRSLFRKLHVRNRTEAAILYTQIADRAKRYEE